MAFSHSSDTNFKYACVIQTSNIYNIGALVHLLEVFVPVLVDSLVAWKFFVFDKLGQNRLIL